MRAKRLGRGLGSLLNRTEEPAPPPAPRGEPATDENGAVHQIPLEGIRPNPYQPRTAFPEESLRELEASVREHGILQPVVVRRGPLGYELVVGERRLKAARAAGLDRIPALVREASDEEMQTLALVENLQREDLNAMEKARALRSAMRHGDLTQEQVAARVGKARTTIANLLRLLDLPAEVQTLVEEGALSGAHARALLQAQGTRRRVELANLAVRRGLSVRDLERRTRQGPTVGRRRTPAPDPYVADLEQRLGQALDAEVRIRRRGDAGRIEIRYENASDLDRLLERLQA